MEFSFKDILQIIKKNIIFIIIVSLLFSVCAFFVTTFFVQKTYTATVKLYVSSDYKDTGSGYEDLNRYNLSSKLVATYIGLLDTNNFYEAVSKTLNNKYTATELKSMVKFTAIEDTELFKADVVSNSPAEAKSVADAVAQTAPETISGLLSNNSKLKIVDEATTPQKPTSPNVTRNVLIALLLGLVLSIIIAFIRDYFDVKIKYNDEMTTINNVPVLAAIPDFEYFAKNLKTAQAQKD